MKFLDLLGKSLIILCVAVAVASAWTVFLDDVADKGRRHNNEALMKWERAGGIEGEARRDGIRIGIQRLLDEMDKQRCHCSCPDALPPIHAYLDSVNQFDL